MRQEQQTLQQRCYRLKTTLTLERKDLTSTDDTDFVELIRLRDGLLVSQARSTEFSILGDVQKRTFDESGDYTVRPFQFEVKESVDNDFKGRTNPGTYATGGKTDSSATASESLLNVRVSPGKETS